MTAFIAACRDIDPERLEAMFPGEPLPPVYPGATAGACRDCTVAVWIGPKAQEAIEQLPDVWIMCFPCAVKTKATTVLNLGNPYVRKDPK